MPEPLIALIPTHGRPRLLRRTLDSLREAVTPSTVAALWVIENGSQSGVEQAVAEADLPCEVRYLFCPTAGMSAALNFALKHVDSAWLWFLNDDLRVSASAVEAYASIRRNGDRNTFFGGPMGVDYETPPVSWLVPYLPRSARGWKWDPAKADGSPEAYQPSRDVPPRPLFLGANWAAHSETVRRAGGFREQLGPGEGNLACGCETDLQLRLYRLGCRSEYLPSAIVYHWVPRSRCTPRWAVRRAYKMGVGAGMAEVDPSATLFGYPRWMVRVWLGKACRYVLTRLAPSPETRFRAAYDFALFAGQMEGKRLARKRASGRSPHPAAPTTDNETPSPSRSAP
ncbi:MAG: glycosyltransferase family 2 protein [Planctomycetota bacterium]|nr:MAG: glycosyltransferase family 2 protein [Planctomycetota bacterium]